jgi:hypothetical protein
VLDTMATQNVSYRYRLSVAHGTAPIVSEQCVQSLTRSAEPESGRMVMACGVVRRTYAGTSLRVKRITAKPMATVA